MLGTTLGLIALGTAIAGTAVSAVGQFKAGNAAKRAGDFNANILEQQAGDAVVRGREEESRFRTQVRSLIGSQRAGFAGQGVDVNSGSAREVQQDAARLGELDALQIRANAQREAWGFNMDAENARMGGQAAQSAGRWGAAATVTTGAGSILMDRYGWRRNPSRAS